MTTENSENDLILPNSDMADSEAPLVREPSLMRTWVYPLLVVAAFMLGLLVSDQAWGRQSQDVVIAQAAAGAAPTEAAAGKVNNAELAELLNQVNPPQGYKLPVSYGELGPGLLKSGAIDYHKFAAVFVQGGDPLTQTQIDILKQGSSQSIVINSQNAHFLLNFFWAVGLVNQNSILTDGPITQQSQGHIDQFASTGGWTLGAKPVTELFASTKLIELTPEQQARVEEVAAAVYRPCCDNPTLFPDCNHGMAMLGLLELMASRDSSVSDMLTAAKYVNAYWFPQQAVEIAIYLKATQKVDFAQADPRTVIGKDLSSGSGSARLHAVLQSSGLLPQSPDSGGGCGT